MKAKLELSRLKDSDREVSAGWLPGDDAGLWLAEWSRCLAQGSEMDVFPVAKSLSDPECAGALLVPRDGGVPTFGPRVIGLAELLPGVFAPRDAWLAFDLLDRERGFLFPHQVHLFHPVLGVVGFDRAEAISPESLLVAPPPEPSAWDGALEAPPEMCLKSIAVALPPGPEDLLEEAGKDIGSDPSGLSKKDRGIGRKAGIIGAGLAGGALMGLGKVASMFGSGVAKHPGKLSKWAEKNWKEMMDSRQRELNRLDKMMRDNPDEALRYALPLAGDPASRGVAPPSFRLGMRSVRFGLGGSGPTDVWDIDNDMRLKLERRYREAAAREIEMGRLERAAYIYGNLLGDWSSAAKALSDAGRHRDAISIYLHKLSDKRAAARCLEEAGMLMQAADLYVESEEFEKAGDLRLRMGEKAEAQRLWRLAVDQARDPLKQASILSDKIKDREEALEVLDRAWISDSRTSPIISRMMTMFREDDKLDAADDLFARMVERADRVPALLMSDYLCLGLDEGARWKEFGERIEERVWDELARGIDADTSDSKKLLELLPRLDSRDVLLMRDAKRYSVPRRTIKAEGVGLKRGVLRPISVVEIPMKANWQSLARLKDGVSIAGHAEGMLAAAQLSGHRCTAAARRTADDPGGDAVVRHVTLGSRGGNSRLYHFPEHGRLHYQPMDRQRSEADEVIGTLRNILAIGSSDERGEFGVLEHTETSSLTAHFYGPMADRRRSVVLDVAPPTVTGMAWFLAGDELRMCLAADGFFAWRFMQGEFSVASLPGRPCRLALSPISGSKVALLVVSRMVLVIEAGKPGKPLEPINLHEDPSANDDPVACFLADGSIAVVWRGGGAIFHPGQYLDPGARLAFAESLGTPVDACAHGANGLMVLTDQGRLLSFG